MTEKMQILELRALARGLYRSKCFQPSQGWDEQFCEESECQYLTKEGGCSLQDKYYQVMAETSGENKLPF